MKRAVAVTIFLLQAATLHGEMLYTWKDAGGTVFYTNSLHEIPARYLRKARVLDVASGKLGGLAVDQPVVQSPPQSPVQVSVPAAPVAPVAQGVSAAPSAPPSPAPPAAQNATFSRPPAPPVPAASAQPLQTAAQRRAYRRAHRTHGGEE